MHGGTRPHPNKNPKTEGRGPRDGTQQLQPESKGAPPNQVPGLPVIPFLLPLGVWLRGHGSVASAVRKATAWSGFDSRGDHEAAEPGQRLDLAGQ